MTGLGTAVVVLIVGAFIAWRTTVHARVRREQRAALQPGSVVFVRTPDRKMMVATVLSRGPSHFWIELLPGDARWWVPATAVEPAPPDAVRETQVLRRTPRPAPRPMLDSESESRVP
jgi:hypothetical protein